MVRLSAPRLESANGEASYRVALSVFGTRFHRQPALDWELVRALKCLFHHDCKDSESNCEVRHSETKSSTHPYR